MPYATEADLIQFYGTDTVVVASDRDNDGTSDAGVIDATLVTASATIDSYLAVRYTLPLPEVPESLKRCCSDIAIYQLSADCAVATDEQRRRYDDCIAWLKLLAAGKISLGLEAPNPEGPDPAGDLSVHSAPRRFSRDTLRGF